MIDEKLFAGIRGIELVEDEYDLGHGVVLRKTFAYLFSTFMMAFKPPIEHAWHDGPWKAAKGGFGYDIFVELEVSDIDDVKGGFNKEEIVWLIGAVIRLAYFPYIMVPAVSTLSFSTIVESKEEPTIYPPEVTPRFFTSPEGEMGQLTGEQAQWIKDNWLNTAKLMKARPVLYSAMKAFDSSTTYGRVSTSLISLWGAIEQLFSPNPGELRFRVSANLASFLEKRGPERLILYKKLLRLYNERSTAAHTAKDVNYELLIETYVYIRNALIKIIENGEVPNPDLLEDLMFVAE